MNFKFSLENISLSTKKVRVQFERDKDALPLSKNVQVCGGTCRSPLCKMQMKIIVEKFPLNLAPTSKNNGESVPFLSLPKHVQTSTDRFY